MLSEIEIDTLRSQGVSEEEIVLRNGGPLPFASFGEAEYMPRWTAMAGDEVDMGFSRDENGNPIINPDNLVAATPVFAPPEPSQAAIDAGIANDVNEPAYIQAQQQREQQQVQAQQSQAPVVQQQREQAEQMNGIGGPDTPVDNGLQGFDPMGSFLGGFASSQAPAYSGSLQAIAAAFGGGSAAMQRDMAVARKGVNLPNSVKEFEYAKANSGYTGSYTDFKDQFGGNMLLKAMAGQQAATIAAEGVRYDREQDTQKEQIAAEKETYKRSAGSIPAGYETHELKDGSEVVRPRIGTEKYEESIEGGNAVKRAMEDVSQLRGLLTEHGSEAWGTQQGKMTSIHKKILQNLAKAWQMGALSREELMSITESLPNPGAIQGTLTGNNKMDAQLKIYEDDFRNKLGDSSTQMRRWGYKDPWAKDGVIKLPPRNR